MYNYHTHTKRCNHAIGEDKEYVEAAIKANYKGLGFSDHVMLPGVFNSGVRGDYTLKEDYFSSIRKLQEEYKDKIEIYLGFECEYSKQYVKYYKELLDSKQVDYLIFGNHNLYFKNGERYYTKKSNKQYLQRYLKKALKGIRTGLFKVMAHPDIFMGSVPWNNDSKKVATAICKEAKKYNVALEINCGCIINEEPMPRFGELRWRYPYIKFWEIAKKYNNTVVVGVDAHNPNALTSDRIKLAHKLAKDVGIVITEKLDIVSKKEG